MNYEKLHKNSKKSWFISRAIVFVFIGIPILALRFLIIKDVLYSEEVALGVGFDISIGIIVLFLLLNTLVYPSFEYKQWKYAITKDKVEFSEGIFFIKTVIIPIVRIQHIQVNQGPINRWLGLASIVISTAGGIHKIPNIELAKAEEISELLKNKVKERVEENVQ